MAPFGLAWGDFRDRTRRPAYAVTLLGAVGLGYLAVPARDSHWVIVQLGDYRGVYNSAYVGMATALAGALWLALAGFYVVRNAIARDEHTRVGQLLAASPLRTGGYLLGKFLSNLLVLGSMLVVLVLTAVVMQFARGEDTSFDPGALLMPFLVISLPIVALTAAVALLFELVPPLSAGLGNVIWFFVWLVVATSGQGPGAPLGGLGVHAAVGSMAADMAAQHIDAGSAGDFSLGLTYLDHPLLPFVWHGFTPGGGFLLDRLVLLGIAVLIAMLPALWFGRFDPARSGLWIPAIPVLRFGGLRLARPRRAPRPTGAWTDSAADGSEVADRPAARPGEGAFRETDRDLAARLAPAGRAPTALARLVLGELRILGKNVSRWWWIGLAGIVVLTFAAPIAGVTRLMLPAAWIWPVVLWSRLGTQQDEYGVRAILGPYPAVRGRVFAEWVAGFLLTVFAGASAAIRMAIAGDLPGLAAFAAGALFITSLAQAFGAVGRSHRLFQALYLPLWYAAVNGLSALDYMGSARVDGRPAGLPAPLVAVVGAVLLAVALAAGSARRTIRT